MHEGNTMRKIMGNKPQVSSAVIIQSSANILEWPSAPGLETLDVHLAPWWDAWFGLIRSSRHTSFIAYERGWVIFEYSHVFRSGGSLMVNGHFKKSTGITFFEDYIAM
jgi:hypothetical protein